MPPWCMLQVIPLMETYFKEEEEENQGESRKRKVQPFQDILSFLSHFYSITNVPKGNFQIPIYSRKFSRYI